MMIVVGGALSGPGELEAKLRELGMYERTREEREAELREAFAPTDKQNEDSIK